MASNLYTADRRLYLDKNGKVVEADDPTRATLLVNQGGTLPMERAQELGLVSAEGKAVARAPENKAMSGPAETKEGESGLSEGEGAPDQVERFQAFSTPPQEQAESSAEGESEPRRGRRRQANNAEGES